MYARVSLSGDVSVESLKCFVMMTFLVVAMPSMSFHPEQSCRGLLGWASASVLMTDSVDAGMTGAGDALGRERDALGRGRDALGRERDVLVEERDALGRERDVLVEGNAHVEERDVLVEGNAHAPTGAVHVPAGEAMEPSVCEPSVWKPSVGEPSVCEPSVCEPSVGEPSVCEPSVGEPSVGEPSVGEPSVGGPSGAGTKEWVGFKFASMWSRKFF